MAGQWSRAFSRSGSVSPKWVSGEVVLICVARDPALTLRTRDLAMMDNLPRRRRSHRLHRTAGVRELPPEMQDTPWCNTHTSAHTGRKAEIPEFQWCGSGRVYANSLS